MIDEISQIGPRPMLKLLELQAQHRHDDQDARGPGAGAGDRGRRQRSRSLRRALPPEALPELLTTMRQVTQRGREIAGLFREGKAAEALAMKREDGHAHARSAATATRWSARSPTSTSSGATSCSRSGSKRGITISAPTNEDAADISQAIRSG